MPHLEWNDSFVVGHYLIDQEHRIFLDLINDLAEKVARRTDERTLRRLANGIGRYAAFHFESEEAIMAGVGYPDLAQHRALHQSLLTSYTVYLREHEEGLESWESLIDFLFDWFSHHTMLEDRKIAGHIGRTAKRRTGQGGERERSPRDEPGMDDLVPHRTPTD